MTPDQIALIQAVAATAAAANGLFFIKFWRQTNDSLFVYFGAAFWLLALSWGLLAISSPQAEERPYIYGVRLLAFLLLITATVSKSREP